MQSEKKFIKTNEKYWNMIKYEQLLPLSSAIIYVFSIFYSSSYDPNFSLYPHILWAQYE